jgi:enoyl-CoA hydratase/carnithine racemase
MLERQVHDGDILELRLARPPANALDPGLIGALRAAVEAAPASGARALVLSGRPGMFSGGLDVPALLPLSNAEIAATWHDFYGLMAALARSPVPVAAAITGHSPAGGAVLAIWCDYRVMAEGDFRIGLNEVRVGLPIPPVIFHALRRQVGERHAERLGVAGLLVTAAEALAIDLVDELVPVEAVVPRAVEWCRGLLALPPGAMAETRRLARRTLVSLFEGDPAAELVTLVEQWTSAETQGAMRALVAKLAAKRG